MKIDRLLISRTLHVCRKPDSVLASIGRVMTGFLVGWLLLGPALKWILFHIFNLFTGKNVI